MIINIIINSIASFLAVLCFSIVMGVPKKFLAFTAMTGMVGWIVFLIWTNIFKTDIIMASLISAVAIAIVSMILSRIFKVVVTIFFIPGILPIVPGVSLYRMMYNLVSENMELVKYYFFETLLISGAIALSIFIIESISNIKFKKNDRA